jgi:hypothetical protein
LQEARRDTGAQRELPTHKVLLVGQHRPQSFAR